MELTNKFANMLKYLLSTRNIKQTELARSIGVKPNTISNYCNKVSQPDVDIIIKIAEFFDVSIDYLLTDTRKENQILREELGLSDTTLEVLAQTTERKYFDELIKDYEFREAFIHTISNFETNTSIYQKLKKVNEAVDKLVKFFLQCLEHTDEKKAE
ncbi:MAG: helix-turn-helix domain-containing protein [Synergistaceae bacterium]|nr:helix-turn-helix domain-containing protein [Synergistaceae bacterium]